MMMMMMMMMIMMMMIDDDDEKEEEEEKGVQWRLCECRQYNVRNTTYRQASTCKAHSLLYVLPLDPHTGA
jgi:hypothetical protein